MAAGDTNVTGPLAPLRIIAGAAAIALLVQTGASRPAESPFLVAPYLQLGDVPKLSPVEPVRVLWQTPHEPATRWTVEVRQSADDPWRPAVGVEGRLIAAESPYRLFSVALT